ncbi:MAG: hypothetical protein LBR31_05275 [Desulfovibrio sp.]|jgi:hypothetical protein|nr:hypothetical protein [Desulfovibrio sp.]
MRGIFPLAGHACPNTGPFQTKSLNIWVAGLLLQTLLMPTTALAQSPHEVTELWTGGIYASTYRAGLCFSANGAVRGVVRLRQKNGQVDVYHIHGAVRGRKIEASHSSGHTFKGELLGADKVEGTITLKNGLRIDLEGERRADVPLDMEDCAPPDED